MKNLYYRHLLPLLVSVLWLQTISFKLALKANSLLLMTSKKRASLSTPIVERLREHGCLDGLQESDQISLFS